jgi:hypothetical protein
MRLEASAVRVEKPRYRLEVRAATYPVEEWLPMRKESGKVYTFVERTDADAVLAKLKGVQPHLVARIAPM